MAATAEIAADTRHCIMQLLTDTCKYIIIIHLPIYSCKSLGRSLE